MEHSGMHRRLAAVLTAGVVVGDGSTDESASSDRLRQLRAELIEPAVSAHEGRIVEDRGSELLAEFVTAVEALRCAAEIQRTLCQPESAFQAPPPLQLRMAVNLGDVFAEGGDIRGDAVVIARRIEGMAEPGGICITRSLLGQVKDLEDVAFEDLGEIEVEHFPEPVHVFEVLLDPDALRRGAAVPEDKVWYRQWPALALGLAVFAFLMSAGLWLFARGPVLEPLPPPPMDFPLPDRT